MADLTITAANVIAAAGAIKATGTAGATIVAGNIVYLDAADRKYKLADADALPAGVSKAYMALSGAADGQPITVLRTGDVALGSVLTAGSRYYMSGTAGAIAPEADLAFGDAVILLGLAKSATTLAFAPQNPGVVL